MITYFEQPLRYILHYYIIY